MTNIWLVPIAYKLAMTQLMVDHVNRIALDLDLPCKKPIYTQEIQRVFVANPLLGGTVPDLGGTITGSNFEFSFTSGKCWYIFKHTLSNGRSYLSGDPMMELLDVPLKVTTNAAYALATNWLTCFKINMAALHARYPLQVGQQEVYDEDGNLRRTAVFSVRWGSGDENVVKVRLLGTTGELLELRVNDPRLNGQSPLQLPNWRELMKTPEKQLERGTSPAASRRGERSVLRPAPQPDPPHALSP
jgi:hypothetical protein